MFFWARLQTMVHLRMWPRCIKTKVFLSLFCFRTLMHTEYETRDLLCQTLLVCFPRLSDRNDPCRPPPPHSVTDAQLCHYTLHKRITITVSGKNTEVLNCVTSVALLRENKQFGDDDDKWRRWKCTMKIFLLKMNKKEIAPHNKLKAEQASANFHLQSFEKGL